jgi:hypothetical protein
MPITATKNGITRQFSDTQWKNMPHDKYGWTAISSAPNTTAQIPPELIQKKMVAGAVDAKPTEIIKQKTDVPEELISKTKPVKKGSQK